MRQHIIRALVVLLVAGVLAAGWYGVAQTAGAQAPVPARERTRSQPTRRWTTWQQTANGNVVIEMTPSVPGNRR